MKKTILWAILAMLLPITQAWGSSYYAKGVVKVATSSASGAGKVYVTCVNKDAAEPSAPASSSYTTSTEKQSSSSSGASYDFYFYALPTDGNCKFLGWSATDGGTDLGTDNPYKMTITAPTSNGTTEKTLYALFSRETTITAQAVAGGTYTVKTAGEDKTVPSSFKTSDVVELEATPTGGSRFVGWVSEGASGTKWFSYDKKVSVSFAESSTIYPVFASSSEVVTANVYKDIMDGASAKVIEIPVGTEVIVANDVTMNVKAGQRVTVNGTLRVLGSLSVSGVIDGSGKVVKGTVTVTQDPNDIIEPYSAEKYEEDMQVLSTYKGRPALHVTTFKYQKTTTAKHGEGAITVKAGSSLSCPIAWECVVSGISTNYVKVSSPSDAVNALRCKVDVGVAMNHITNVVAVYAKVGEAVRRAEGASDQFAVLLADATESKVQMTLDDFPSGSGWRSTGKSGEESKVGKKQIRVDCASHSLNATFEYNNSSGITSGWYLNGASVSHGKVSRARVCFMNCDSVSVEINSGDGYESRVELFDCGKLANLGGQYGTDLPSVTDTSKTWRGGAYFYSGGPYAVTWGKNLRAWGGTFVNNPYASDSADYRASAQLSVKKVGEYWVVSEREPSENVAKVGDVEYASVKDAIQAVVDSGNPGVVRLTAHCQLTDDVEIPANANVRIELASYWIGGTAKKITNRGTLEIGDGTNYQEGKGSVLGATIENFGTMIICYGNFEGNFVAKAGTIRIYDGYFNGTLTKENDGAYDIRGGNFKNSVSSLLTDSMAERKIGGRYYAGRTFGAVVNSVSAGRYERGYSVEALDAKQSAAFLGPILRSNYVSDEDWYYHVETCAAIKPYANWTIDAVVSFDRDTAKESVLLNSMYTERPLDRSITANEAYRCMSPVIKEQGYYQITYSRFLAGDPAKSVSMYIGNNNVEDNIGTVCTLEMRLYESDSSYLTIARRRFVFGAASNTAMIRPVIGAATFYATPDAALAAVEGNGTVMLTGDYAANVTIAKTGVYTLDPNGFDFTGTVVADTGLKVTQDGNTYTVESTGVTITVPDVENMTKVVKIGDVVQAATEGTSYLVPQGSIVTIVYTAKTGYMGSFEKTIYTASATTFELTDAEKATAVKVVAKIGETPYAALSNALAAAKSGATIETLEEGLASPIVDTLGKDAKTLTFTGKTVTLNVAADNVNLTGVKGTLVMALSGEGADTVLELKKGTDATIAWPTEAEEVAKLKEYVRVTGGDYSSDPTPFLADGLEANLKDEKYVVGVKVAIIIKDSNQETTNVTAVLTVDSVSKVDTNAVNEVVKGVAEDKKAEVAEKLNTNTSVEGVQLTTVDEKVVDEQTEEETVVRTNGVAAVVLLAKEQATADKDAVGKTQAEKQEAEKFVEAISAAEDKDVTIKVEVQVKPQVYVEETTDVSKPAGEVRFELKPEALVMVKLASSETVVTQKVEVTNEMIDQTQNIKVTMYMGFRPKLVVHSDAAGNVIETYTGDKIEYDEANGNVTIGISHFSEVAGYQNNYVAQVTKGGVTTKYESLYDALTNAVDGGTVVLLQDVNLKDVAWTPVGTSAAPFAGTFDGAGHTISNLTIDTASTCQGLFGYVTGGTVKNLNLAAVNVKGGKRTGAVVAYLKNGGRVENVHVLSGSVSGKTVTNDAEGSHIGGIVGCLQLDGVITNCSNAAAISGYNNVGGISGSAYCTAEGKNTTIAGCTNTGTVTGYGAGTGGIVGLSSGDIVGNRNTGIVANVTESGTGVSSVGGIVGEQKNAGSVSDNTNDGDVSTANASAYGTGGIVGWTRYSNENDSYGVRETITVTGNENNGNVHGGNDAGGIVGTAYNNANVSGNENNARIVDSYSYALSSTTFTAGIVGNYQTVGYVPTGIAQDELVVSNNTSKTYLTEMAGTCTDPIVYGNGNVVKGNNNYAPDIPTLALSALEAVGRYPWNAKLDVYFKLSNEWDVALTLKQGDTAIAASELFVVAENGGESAFSGKSAGSKSEKTVHLVWNPISATPGVETSLTVTATAFGGAPTNATTSVVIDNATVRVANPEKETLLLPRAWGVTSAVTLTTNGVAVGGLSETADTYVWNTTKLSPGSYAFGLTAGEVHETATFIIQSLADGEGGLVDVDNEKNRSAGETQDLLLPAAWGETAAGYVTISVTNAYGEVVKSDSVPGSTRQWTFTTTDLEPGTYGVVMSWNNGTAQTAVTAYAIEILAEAEWGVIVIDNTRKAIPAETEQDLPLPASWDEQVAGSVTVTVTNALGETVAVATVPGTTEKWTLNTDAFEPGTYGVTMSWGDQSVTATYGIAILAEAEWGTIVIDNVVKVHKADESQELPMPAAWDDSIVGNVLVEVIDENGNVVASENVSASADKWTLSTGDLEPGTYRVRISWTNASGNKTETANFYVDILAEAEWGTIVIDNRIKKDVARPAADSQDLPTPYAWGDEPTGSVTITLNGPEGYTSASTVEAGADKWTLKTGPLMPGVYEVVMSWTDAAGSHTETVKYRVSLLAEAEWGYLEVDNLIKNRTRKAKDAESIALPASWGEKVSGDVTITLTDADGVVTTKTVSGTDQSWSWNTVPVMPGAWGVNIAWKNGTTGDTNVTYTIAGIAEDAGSVPSIDNLYEEEDAKIRHATNHVLTFNLQWTNSTFQALTMDGKSVAATPDAAGLWEWNTNGLLTAVYTFTNKVYEAGQYTYHEAKFRLEVPIQEVWVYFGGETNLLVSTDWYQENVGELEEKGAMSDKMKGPAANGYAFWKNYVMGWSPTNANERLLVKLTAFDPTTGELTAKVEGMKNEPAELGNVTLKYVLKQSTDRKTGFVQVGDAKEKEDKSATTVTFPNVPFGTGDSAPVQKYYRANVILEPAAAK